MPSDSTDEDQTNPRVILALQLGMILALVVSLGSIAFSLIMPDVDISVDMIDKVSGYYGPGSVIAWLILTSSCFEFKYLFKFVFLRWLLGSEFIGVDLVSGLEIDGAVLGTVAYPLIAFVDLVLQLVMSSRSDGATQSLYGIIDPHVAVMHLASAISIIALAAHALLLFLMLLVKDYGIPTGTYRRMMRLRRIRLALWTAVFLISQISISLTNVSFKSNAISELKHWSKSLISLLSATAALVPDGYSSGGSIQVAWAFFVIINLIALPRITINSGEKYDTRFPFPRSSARLSDLDQAAALAVALWTTGTSFARWVAKTLEARSIAVPEHDTATANDLSSHEINGAAQSFIESTEAPIGS